MIQPRQRMELFFWSSVPSLLTLLLMIFCLIPKHLSGFASFMPLLPLMPIFYWGMQHAREMPYWLVFFIGLMMDAVMGAPLGVSSLLYVFFLALLHAQRKYIHKEGFLVKWAYFASLLVGMSVMDWLLFSLSNSQAGAFSPAAMQWALTVGCYPLFHKLFDKLYEFVQQRRWRILHGS